MNLEDVARREFDFTYGTKAAITFTNGEGKAMNVTLRAPLDVSIEYQPGATQLTVRGIVDVSEGGETLHGG